jgi:hypothetical protein
MAEANEAIAKEILARLDSLPSDAQQRQRLRASQVMAEVLKKRAAELRKLEGGIRKKLHAVSRMPDDRHQGCARTRTTRHDFR